MSDKSNAIEFFQQLEAFSQRYWKESYGKNLVVLHYTQDRIGPWRGAILHYTAEDDLDRVVNWFTREESKVSSHVVVHDRRMGCHSRLAEDLPLVQQLPATVIQCVPPWHRAWHATWTNSQCYGIECTNAGKLKYNDNNELCTWRPRDQYAEPYTTPWHSSYKTVAQLYDAHWVRYTQAQIAAVIHVLRHLWLLGELTCRPRRPWIVGHEQVQRGKLDPGPDFPLHGVREASFDDWRPCEHYPWWHRFADPGYGAMWRQEALTAAVGAIAGKGTVPSPHVAWRRARAAWGAMMDAPYEGKNPAWIKLGFWLLGYHMTRCSRGDYADTHYDSDDATSVWIFQRRTGLNVDGKAGPQTAKALADRLQEVFGDF